MDVLAVVHGTNARAGIFADAVREHGHTFDEWSLAWGSPPPRPIDDYGAVFVFGGSMHADQEERHPWLRDEDALLRRLIDRRVPLLGVCLGAQLIAKACGAGVRPAEHPEIGWVEVELTQAGNTDPVLGSLPERFQAFQWHSYTYAVPAGADELARSAACTQAFRLGERAWGIQFHAEIVRETLDAWLADPGRAVIDTEQIAAETDALLPEWNRLGRELCGAFVAAAERAA